jgi:hypothetical protein
MAGVYAVHDVAYQLEALHSDVFTEENKKKLRNAEFIEHLLRICTEMTHKFADELKVPSVDGLTALRAVADEMDDVVSGILPLIRTAARRSSGGTSSFGRHGAEA